MPPIFITRTCFVGADEVRRRHGVCVAARPQRQRVAVLVLQNELVVAVCFNVAVLALDAELVDDDGVLLAADIGVAVLVLEDELVVVVCFNVAVLALDAELVDDDGVLLAADVDVAVLVLEHLQAPAAGRQRQVPRRVLAQRRRSRLLAERH